MEKERYEELLRKLQRISEKLVIVINNLELLKNDIVNTIVIGDNILYKEDVIGIYEQCYNNKNNLDNIIIPTIRNKINEFNI